MGQTLNDASVRGWMGGRDGWKKQKKRLVKDFDLGSFRDSIVFVNRVATLADQADHHPDIDVRYDHVVIGLSTHDAGGITEKDLDLAEKIDFATSTR